ncbi:hypothetical protein NIES37_16710 [Tolypothrix tenuis PCC 7101]|uniref:Uncharacterized protein n=1 Tax=Tolypothrix tenuis PCC 7101 TaxID=231146 RepID=A0A1Z4MW90_9CYAN|nr:hypothetical protein [Aulosira sp. FACHB-113]BAY97727.1 hypothetical protein NIES37_16710 [Tolypothrix tenuis PCC 7101]BAZ71766.1 hypothetical protein NIES50_03130 [Aulosira laxa NIES-50]
MPTHGPKSHTIDSDGNIILKSKHLGDVIEVNIDKVKRRFYGIKLDGTRIEDDGDCGGDFAQPVMLYKVYYCFANDTWGIGYRTKDKNEKKWRDGFKTAREAWLYREALIAGGIAKR